jgi:hypothetical protein
MSLGRAWLVVVAHQQVSCASRFFFGVTLSRPIPRDGSAVRFDMRRDVLPQRERHGFRFPSRIIFFQV